MKYKSYIESWTPEAKVFHGSLNYGCGSKKEAAYVKKCMEEGKPFYVKLHYPNKKTETFVGTAVSYYKDKTPDELWTEGKSFSFKQGKYVPCRYRFILKEPLKIYQPFEKFIVA